eukprot:SM006268S19844  [mRNA]  locus=s6268:2:771:- [translate_table: standard]
MVSEVGAIEEAEVVLRRAHSAVQLVKWFNGYDFKGSTISVAIGKLPVQEEEAEAPEERE